ncbi:armadillo-type protein [Pisolithus croceorrhizus]|nr:armadillo-type protein [Pisolithus croceorrhizus]
MGQIVSHVDIQHSCSSTQLTSSEHSSRSSSSSARPTVPPNHINLTAPQVLGAFVSSPSVRDNPFESPPSSPPLPFYTAPSTPLTSPQAEDPPLNSPALSLQQPPSGATNRFTSPPHTNPLLPPLTPPVELETDPLVEAYPVFDTATDFALDDEGLSTLEKIYLFSRSRSAHHRVFISHALPSFLAHVTPLEAVEYVLPLLPSLAMDEDEAVKEALASELVGILWWFLTRCRLVEESTSSTDCQPNYTDGDVTLMSVQAFTPILGTLLLSPNGMVSGPTRCAVVELLGRMNKADAVDEGVEKDDSADDCGLFGRSQRKLFADEILQQIVIGIGRLDAPAEEVVDVWYDASARTPAMEMPGQASTSAAVDQPYDPAVNPYFPVPPPSPSSPVSPLAPCSLVAIPVPVPSVSVVPPSPPPSVAPLLEFSPTEPPSPITSISIHYEEAGSSPTKMTNSYGSVVPAAPQSIDVETRREPEEESDANEQAAVGRLSSMSLIAAVTAGGSLGPDTQRTFVREAERAGKDPVYWVRREASFALGALAKVVPEELVVFTLLPLFESLRSDSVWNVRHSSLFALPAVLSRLPPSLRRTVALSTLLPLSRDESPAVRSGVLEALGEVLYTFHTDKDGPPSELLQLFLGREKPLKEQHPVACRMPGAMWSVLPHMDFFDDPARPLACAFNYPAVALTLGPARWGELREYYLTLAQCRMPKVRRTLAASLGELARVIGAENATRDLLQVWWDAMQYEDDGDVRLKAIEALPQFVDSLGEGKARDDIFTGLVKAWEEGWLSRNWRARECLLQVLGDLSGSPSHPDCVHRLLKNGLEDDFGTVRDAAIHVVARIWANYDTWAAVLDGLRRDITTLAYAPSYRKRMTYIACQQSLVLTKEKNPFFMNDTNWEAVTQLARDRVVGVRIGVARLTKSLYDKDIRSFGFAPQRTIDLVEQLRHDASAEVRSYVPNVVDVCGQTPAIGPNRSEVFATFSRPPPTTYRLESDAPTTRS